MAPVNWDGTEKVMGTQAVTTVILTNDVIQNLILLKKKKSTVYIHTYKCDINGIQTHNNLVGKRTLNHIAKLVIVVTAPVSITFSVLS